MNRETLFRIAKFVDKHDVSMLSQMLVLQEEVGELAEAVVCEDTDAIIEEAADVIFVAASLGAVDTEAEVSDIEMKLRETARENTLKDTTQNGSKVTKESTRDDD